MAKRRVMRRGKKSRSKGSEVFDANKGTTLSLAPPPVQTIWRPLTPGTLVKGIVDAGVGITFELNNITAVSEITSMYSQYKIAEVEYVWELVTPFLNNIPYPRLAVAVDYTNGVAPASETEVLEYNTAKIYQFGPNNTKFTLKFAPRVAVAAFQSAVSTGYLVPDGTMWASCLNTGIDHYGLRVWISDYNTTTSTIPQIRVYGRYKLLLRGTD